MYFSDLGKLSTSALHFTNVGALKGTEIIERHGSKSKVLRALMERHCFTLKEDLQKERKHRDTGELH